MAAYNVSSNPSKLNTADWDWYDDQLTANDAAIADARDTGQTHYVHEVTFRPVFKAEVTTQVTTEVM